jgi:pSer/pThr/pTyr-binding forkhead associated (FHA) protein
VQRAIVELRHGPAGGTKMILSPGERLCVGRKPRAQWIISDKQMSGVHFEIAYDGARCEVRDLQSAQGTLVGGQRIEAPAVVGNGAWIRAGESDFMVYLEASTPPEEDELTHFLEAEPDEIDPLAAEWVEQNRAELLRDRAAAEARAEAALARLRRVEAPLFVVLDAARTDRILTLVRESVENYRSLYEGIEGAALEHVAPHLVELPPGSALLERLLREGWGRRWGIFIEYPRSFKELRRHLRRFLMVADADTRKKFYFRFYDPVVLREFVPTCTPKQRAELFGEIGAFLVEDERGRVARFAGEAS